jgi:putative two-component system response regulator
MHAVSLRDLYDFLGSMNEMAHALEIAREEHDALLEAKILNNLGNTYSDAGLCAEALAMFEQTAVYFETNDDPLSAWMALDNAALAALRLGDIQRGTALAANAKAVWSGKAQTADELLWVVQGALTNCQLLIQADRAEEAAELARSAKAVAESSGLAAAGTLAAIGEAITAYSRGTAGSDAIQQVIARAHNESPNQYCNALDAAIRTYERAGQFDKALELQRELLAFNRKQKFEIVHRTWGRPSPEEAKGVAKLAQLGTAVDRKVTDLVNAAITQALRAGHDHARIFRVSRLAELFAMSEGLPPERAQAIALAAKLMDIGNMVVPDDLLSASRNLSAGEHSIVAEHTQFGADVLLSARLALLEPCVPVVRFHHERWDGTGPCGLKGEDIPLEVRVVTLCDSFDALTHERPWRPAWSREAALREIATESGAHFDPSLTERFVTWIQMKYRAEEDFDAHLAADALDNGYVRLRQRIERLIRSAG